MNVLTGLEPEKVWSFFEDLCRIPHGSYNEKGVSDYCVAFAKERGLKVYQDAAWNVVIIREASEGYESAEPLILQGHLDMVCEKKADCDLDFEKDALRLKVDGEYVRAEGTTLGGDDGIAIAYALAALDDEELPHPRLEAVFTTCEEVGMDGAAALDVSVLKGHTVLNLDSEEEGVLLAGCAGGCSVQAVLPVSREKGAGVRAVLSVNGLTGGHSGTEIDKGRANADVLLAQVLEVLSGKTGCRIISMAGGLKDNAIPREAEAELLFADGKISFAGEVCADCQAKFRETFAEADPGICVELHRKGTAEADVLTKDSARRIHQLLRELPNGVIHRNPDIEGLVQTSLNLGVMRSQDDQIELRISVRSSVRAEKESLVQRVRSISEECGASVQVSGDYPAWEYRKDSPLREKCVRIYRELFGAEPKVEVIHAGLECGLLSGKIPGLDCVSMGPEILDIHTTEEHMSIPSVERMWNYIRQIIIQSK